MDETWTWTDYGSGEIAGGELDDGMCYDPVRKELVCIHSWADVYTTYTYKNHTWTTHVCSTPRRTYGSLAWDPVNEVVLLFGGKDTHFPVTYHNDVWAWNGSSWTQVVADAAPGSPANRTDHRWCIDSLGTRLILFGGKVVPQAPPYSYQDTWSFDLTTYTWTQLFPAHSPGKRTLFCMAYDPSASLIAMGFGGTYNGLGNPGTSYKDLWTWNGTDWTELFPTAWPPDFGDSECYDGFYDGFFYFPPLARLIYFAADCGYQLSDTDIYSVDLATPTFSLEHHTEQAVCSTTPIVAGGWNEEEELFVRFGLQSDSYLDWTIRELAPPEEDMTSLFWRYPAVWEGRIAPEEATYYGDDYGELLYYGDWYVDDWYYYYAGEDTYGLGHVFCLGDDIDPPQIFRVPIGGKTSVEQSFTIDSPRKLIRFAWYMRQPPGIPVARVLVSAGVVDFVTGSLVASGDGLKGFIIETPASQLTPDDADRMVSISGATDAANNGDFRISSVPFNQGDIDGGDRAVIENTALAARADDPAVTIAMAGFNWVARAYVDEGSGYVERVKLTERAGKPVYRGELALHLSKFTGDISVKFEMMLEQGT